MKRLTTVILLAAVIQPAFADETPPKHTHMTWEERFTQANTAHDGHLTLDEAKAEIHEAIEFHLERMREDGLPIPKPSSWAEYVEVGEQAA